MHNVNVITMKSYNPINKIFRRHHVIISCFDGRCGFCCVTKFFGCLHPFPLTKWMKKFRKLIYNTNDHIHEPIFTHKTISMKESTEWR